MLVGALREALRRNASRQNLPPAPMQNEWTRGIQYLEPVEHRSDSKQQQVETTNRVAVDAVKQEVKTAIGSAFLYSLDVHPKSESRISLFL